VAAGCWPLNGTRWPAAGARCPVPCGRTLVAAGRSDGASGGCPGGGPVRHRRWGPRRTMGTAHGRGRPDGAPCDGPRQRWCPVREPLAGLLATPRVFPGGRRRGPRLASFASVGVLGARRAHWSASLPAASPRSPGGAVRPGSDRAGPRRSPARPGGALPLDDLVADRPNLWTERHQIGATRSSDRPTPDDLVADRLDPWTHHHQIGHRPGRPPIQPGRPVSAEDRGRRPARGPVRTRR
jgi:hypothetical protein